MHCIIQRSAQHYPARLPVQIATSDSCALRFGERQDPLRARTLVFRDRAHTHNGGAVARKRTLDRRATPNILERCDERERMHSRLAVLNFYAIAYYNTRFDLRPRNA